MHSQLFVKYRILEFSALFHNPALTVEWTYRMDTELWYASHADSRLSWKEPYCRIGWAHENATYGHRHWEADADAKGRNIRRGPKGYEWRRPTANIMDEIPKVSAGNLQLLCEIGILAPRSGSIDAQITAVQWLQCPWWDTFWDWEIGKFLRFWVLLMSQRF